jgi:hypothetical protein
LPDEIDFYFISTSFFSLNQTWWRRLGEENNLLQCIIPKNGLCAPFLLIRRKDIMVNEYCGGMRGGEMAWMYSGSKKIEETHVY